MKIKTAGESDLTEIVEVHSHAFDGFFLTRMGPRFLKLLYTGFRELDGGICLIARDDRRVVGFVAGTTRPAGFFRELLLKQWWRFALAAVSGILRNPIEVTRRCASAVFYRGERPPNISERSALLSSLAVSPEFAGRGIGTILVEVFVSKARDHGCDSVYLLTDADNNQTVNNFYRKCGMSLVDSFRRTNMRKLNRWILILNK